MEKVDFFAKKNKEKNNPKKKQGKETKKKKGKKNKKKNKKKMNEKEILSSPSPPPSDSEQEIKIAIRKKKKIADLLSSESSSLWETQLNRYYELKQEYEKQERIFFLQKKEKEEEDEDEEDRRRPLCIQCQRPVGTIFGRKYNDRKKCPMVFASCGDRKQPCTLKIIIFTGTFVNIFTKLQILIGAVQ